MTAESEILLLVNECDEILEDPNDEHSDKIKLASPIQRWKQLIGDKDPAEAKTNDPECLRSQFGIDLIKNAFHGSDDEKAANKERDVFLFPIPERPPDF